MNNKPENQDVDAKNLKNSFTFIGKVVKNLATSCPRKINSTNIISKGGSTNTKFVLIGSQHNNTGEHHNTG